MTWSSSFASVRRLATLATLTVAVASVACGDATPRTTPGSSTSASSREPPPPVATAAATLGSAIAAATPGTTIDLAPGTYPPIRIDRSGEIGRPITIRGTGGAVFTGNAEVIVRIAAGVHDVVLDGITVQASPGHDRNGIVVRKGTSRIELRGITVTGAGRDGILVEDTTDLTISGCTIRQNATGVEVFGATTGVIERCTISENQTMITNTEGGDDDHGAYGIAAIRTTGDLLIRGNTFGANRAPSYDYGIDGSGVEIYGASGVRIEGNTFGDNRNAVETGRGPGDPDCERNTLIDNQIDPGPGQRPAAGVILRCARGMVVRGNTITNVEEFALSVGGSGRFAGTIDGIRIEDNLLGSTDGPAMILYAEPPVSARFAGNRYLAGGVRLPNGTTVQRDEDIPR